MISSTPKFGVFLLKIFVFFFFFFKQIIKIYFDTMLISNKILNTHMLN